MTALSDMQGRKAYLQGQWLSLYDAKKSEKNWTPDEADQLLQWQTEMTDLGQKIANIESIEKVSASLIQQNDVKGGRPVVDENDRGATEAGVKSLEERLRDSVGRKTFLEKGRGTYDLTELSNTEYKTLLTLSDAAPQNTRLARVEPYPVERRTVEDLMARGTMSTNVIEYYEETTFTNAAAETAEGEAKPEAALDWTLRSETASKIAVWIPATSESLEDIPWLMSTIQNRLVFMLQRRKETQLMSGDGTAPNISGITDRSGIQTQAKGSDPVPDAILKAANLIRVNEFYEPDAVVIHPNDMQDIRLLRTADGIYIFGSPSDPYTAVRLWGMEVRETTARTENTALVGAFGTATQVFYRTGVKVVVSTEHDDYLIKNKVVVLVEQRLALAVYNAAAFATVTGI